MKPAFLIAALFLPGLGACASVPELKVSGRGHLSPAAPTTFVSEEADEGGAPATASAAVRRALTEEGWSMDSGNPAWRIEIIYSERPESIGAYAGEGPPVAGSSDWSIAPAPRRWWRREARLGVLVVRIVDADSGMEAARIEARAKLSGRPAGTDLERLAAAAVTEALTEPAEPSVAAR